MAIDQEGCRASRLDLMGSATGCPEKIIVAFNKEDDDEVRLGRSKEVGSVGTKST